jgi:hypothetical protein
VSEIQDYQQQERQQLDAEAEEQQLARDATSQQQDHVVFRSSSQDAEQLEQNLQKAGHSGWHWLAWHKRLPPHHEAEELRRTTQVPAT